MSVFDKTLVSADINYVSDPTENTKLQITKSFVKQIQYYEKYKHNLIKTDKITFLYLSMAKYMVGVVYSYIPYSKYTWTGPYSGIKEYCIKYLNSTVDGQGIEIDFRDIQGSHSLCLWAD